MAKVFISEIAVFASKVFDSKLHKLHFLSTNVAFKNSKGSTNAI